MKEQKMAAKAKEDEKEEEQAKLEADVASED